MNPKNLITAAGAERLRQQLKKMKSVDRPAVIAAISEARAHGDLSENAEYDAAKEQQRFVEGRIKELEAGLTTAEIIKPNKAAGDSVTFGAFVELYDAQTAKQITYQLVGNLEADLEQGRVSTQSPIGIALLGKRSGDEIEVAAPAGMRIYEILSVRYE